MQKVKSNPAVKSIGQIVSDVAFKEGKITRDEFKAILVQDMKSCVVFMNEVLSLPEAVEALATVYYDRYTELMAKKNEVPDPAEFNH